MKQLEAETFLGAEVKAKSDAGGNGKITFTDATVADRFRRQIIEAIEACDTVEELDDYHAREALVIDALWMTFPRYADSIDEAAKEWRATLGGAQRPSTAVPCIPTQTYERIITMAANGDFKKLVFKGVDLLWPRIDQTYRYNNAEKRTEPCAATVQGAGYSIAWTTTPAEAKKLKAELQAHYDDCRTRNGKLPEFSKVFGLKPVKDEAGKTIGAQFTAKKNAMSGQGTPNKAPVVVGPDLQPLEDKAIWSGSKGSVRVLAYPVTDPDGVGGISLLLDAIQVTEAVYGGDNLEDDFGPAQPKANPFDSADFDEAPKPKAESKANEAARQMAEADDEF